MNNGAQFSECGKYRYALWRIWNDSKPLVMFVGLNPSTADEDSDDPTIRRLYGFANSWGYGGFYMMNLFAYVTAYPKELQTVEPVGQNDTWLREIGSKCERVVFAWGKFGFKEREAELMKMFPLAYAIALNKDGSPKHPLYIKSDVRPVIFNHPQG